MEQLRISENPTERHERKYGHGQDSSSQKPISPQKPFLRKPHETTIGNQIGEYASVNTNQCGKYFHNNEEIVKTSELSLEANAEIVKASKLSAEANAEIVKASKLSAEAKEFIPKAVPSGKTIRLNDRLAEARKGGFNEYQGNLQQQNFQQQQQPEQYSDYLYHQQRNNSIPGGNDDEFLKVMNTMGQLGSVMHSLTLKPGMYQNLVPNLVKSLMVHLKSIGHFQDIVSAIIQQSINESNFRYSGARLCKSLDTAFTGNDLILYRDILCNLCQDKTLSQVCAWQKTAEHSEDEQKTCHGLILFLAELVVQMEDPRLPLGKQLIQLINVILKNPAPSTVKHVCQALKLAGHALESNNTGSRSEMECMMHALTELVTQGHVDSHVGRMVNSVTELRNGNWGQSAGKYASNIDVAIAAKTPLDGPVLYGPDGNVLSLEESQFLNQNAQDENDSDDSRFVSKGDAEDNMGHPDDYITDDEEEEAIAAAYEKFLETIPQKK